MTRIYNVSWVEESRYFWHRNELEKYALHCSLAQLDIAIGARGLGFNSGAGQIGHSVANGFPPLRCFSELCCPGTKPRRMDPATRDTLGRGNASIMKIWYDLLTKTLLFC